MEHPGKILKSLGRPARKGLGQNFLVPGTWPERIVDAASVGESDVVVEVGPGLGAITEVLARRARRVVGLELDGELAAWLTENLVPDFPNLEIRETDARDVDLSAIRDEAGTPLTLVGNLPYYVSSPLVRWSLAQRAACRLAVFTLQREVAERIAAPPGNKTYGALSALVQLYADARIVLRLPPGAFHPPPEVTSAVIRLDFLEAPRAEVPGHAAFERVVFAAFSQRRKTLSNALKGANLTGRDELTHALQTAGIDGKRRAETLSVEELAALTRALDAVAEL